MNLSRKAQVIRLLLRQERLRHDAAVDDYARADAKLRELSESADELEQGLLDAQSALRKLVQRGAVVDTGVYRSAGMAADQRKREWLAQIGVMESASLELDKLRSELLNHQKRIRKLEEIDAQVSAAQAKERSIAFFNNADDLWLARMQGGHQ